MSTRRSLSRRGLECWAWRGTKDNGDCRMPRWWDLDARRGANLAGTGGLNWDVPSATIIAGPHSWTPGPAVMRGPVTGPANARSLHLVE
jgi:hypothetical protein